MIPKLTDDAVSRLPLEAGRADLLEEIMSTVAPDRQSAEPTPVHAQRRARWLVPLAVAAAVATVASTPLWWSHDDPAKVSSSAPAPFQAAPDSKATGYRAVLTAPGWQVASVEEDSKYGGEVAYANGKQLLEITWYPEDSYQGYLEDRSGIEDPDHPSNGTPVQVLGLEGHLWAYSADDHTVMRVPDQGHWMEFRGSGMDLDAYLALLGQLRLVSLAQLESALPGRFVSADERPAAVQKILDGIERASGATVPAGTTLDTRYEQEDPYQLGAEVVGQYACAWIADFADASAKGDQAGAAEAVRVMGTSRDWPVLQQMNVRGDYPEVVWDYADQLAAGEVPERYRDGLGC